MWLAKVNGWARRWRPLIVLKGVIFGGLALVISDVDEKAPEQDLGSQDSNAVVSEEKTAIPTQPKVLPFTARSAQDNFESMNVIGLQIDCEFLLESENFWPLSIEDKETTRRYCLSNPSRRLFVSHFSSQVRGREDKLIAELGQLFSQVNKMPVISLNDLEKCAAVAKADFSAIIYSSWVSVAAKAFLLVESMGLGAETVSLLQRGREPREALPDEVVLGRIPAVSYLSRSYQVLTTYQADEFLELYTDDELLEHANNILRLMPRELRAATLRSIRVYLERYYGNFKPRSGDKKELVSTVYPERELIEVNSGKIVGNSPRGAIYFSCPNSHIDRFWFRRLINGTDNRFARLAEKLLSDIDIAQ